MSIDPKQIQSDVQRALDEDIGSGDVTAELLPTHIMVEAEIISREPMVVCGIPWAEAVFHQVDASIQLQWLTSDGTYLDKPTTLVKIQGPARSILTAERTALNFLQTLSGTATKTRLYVLQLQNSTTRLLDTRKTLPGLRVAQKYAVLCGGGVNHRMGLYDAFLIKENHIKACGSVSKTVELARQAKKDLLVVIEVQNLDELQEAITAGPDRILLDNFTKDQLVEAVAINQNSGCQLEVSGGVEFDTIPEIAATGVDYISVGGITKSVQAIDLSLLIRKII